MIGTVKWYRVRGGSRRRNALAWTFLRLCDVVGFDRAQRVYVWLMEHSVIATGDTK